MRIATLRREGAVPLADLPGLRRPLQRTSFLRWADLRQMWRGAVA